MKEKVRVVVGISFLVISFICLVNVLVFSFKYGFSFQVFYYALAYIWGPDICLFGISLVGLWLFAILGARFLINPSGSLISSELEGFISRKNIANVIQKTAGIVAIIFAILIQSYITLILFRKLIPLPVFINGRLYVERFMILVFIGLIPILMFVKISWAQKRNLLLMALLVSVGAFVLMGFNTNKAIIESVKLGDKRYHLEANYTDWANFWVIECNQLDLNCHTIFYTYGGNRELVAAESLDELYLFRSGGIERIFGDQEIYHGDADYVINYFEESGKTDHNVWVLGGNDVFRLVHFIEYFGEERDIEILPVKIYIDPDSEFWRPVFDGREWGDKEDGDIYVNLIIDDAGDVSLYVEDALIYSYGSQSQCHVEGCTIVGP